MITIFKGMKFLHGSKLEYHGYLKSRNCIIDGRFVVKLSNYGLRELWKQVPIPENENAGKVNNVSCLVSFIFYLQMPIPLKL